MLRTGSETAIFQTGHSMRKGRFTRNMGLPCGERRWQEEAVHPRCPGHFLIATE